MHRATYIRSIITFLFVYITALSIAQVSGQDINLRGLLKPGAKEPDLAAGYEPVVAWPGATELRDLNAAASAVGVDREGLVWVVSRGQPAVRVFDREGKLVQTWENTSFRKPHGLAFDPDGSIWITDTGTHVACKYARDGRVLRTLGTPNEPGDDSTHFNQPTDVAVARDGTTYVADGYGNNRVVRFDGAGRFLNVIGKEGSALGEFHLPHALALDSRDRLYVADRSNARVQVFDRTGRALAEWRNMIVPWDIWINDRDEVFVCGSSPMRWPKGPRVGVPLGIPPKDQVVIKFATDGRVSELWTFPMGDRTPGALDWVHGIATGHAGELYLCDIEGRRVQKFRRLEPATEAAVPTPHVKK
jgi:peptidylamidoglycolate lyase